MSSTHSTPPDRRADRRSQQVIRDFARALAEFGRRIEGLALAREASALYHELASSEPDVFGAEASEADGLVADLGDNEA